MPNRFQLETERLLLREMTPEDAISIFHLNNDWEVIKYTGDQAFNSVEAAHQFLIHYNDYRKNGYGRWAVIEKKTGAFIGWCGLKLHDDGMVDLGYRLSRKFWGLGYATESAYACLLYGFQQLNIPIITGRVVEANQASVGVLKKLGMQLSRKDSCKEWQEALYFTIHKDSFLQNEGNTPS